MKDEVLKGYAQTRNRMPRHEALALARCWQLALLVAIFVVWHALTTPGLVSAGRSRTRPRRVLLRRAAEGRSRSIWAWFTSGKIYPHLGVTLLETLLAFAIGSAARTRASDCGSRSSPTASALADPYITAMNAMPRVILAPIFAVWFGLGIWSKVALGVTLVFFIVFFNVYQGVKEVSPVVLANARMLGANRAAAAAPRLPAVGDVVGVLEPAHLGRAWRSSARSSASTSARRRASAT